MDDVAAVDRPAQHRHGDGLDGAAGQRDEARASLREFVRRHPDTAVPDDLRPLLGE